MSEKVESGHDNVKKFVDMHKTNEDLTEQLSNKVNKCKEMELKITEIEQKSQELQKEKDEIQQEFETQK